MNSISLQIDATTWTNAKELQTIWSSISKLFLIISN